VDVYFHVENVVWFLDIVRIGNSALDQLVVGGHEASAPGMVEFSKLAYGRRETGETKQHLRGRKFRLHPFAFSTDH